MPWWDYLLPLWAFRTRSKFQVCLKGIFYHRRHQCQWLQSYQDMSREFVRLLPEFKACEIAELSFVALQVIWRGSRRSKFQFRIDDQTWRVALESVSLMRMEAGQRGGRSLNPLVPREVPHLGDRRRLLHRAGNPKQGD